MLTRPLHRLPTNLLYRHGLRAGVSTQIIKAYQQQLLNRNQNPIAVYPKTFEEKMLVLNNPKTLEMIEVIEFGVKYKEGKNWLAILLVALAFFAYAQQKVLPIRIVDKFFNISTLSNEYYSGYLLSLFLYEKPFYLYLPQVLGVYQLTRFIFVRHLAMLLFANLLVGDVISYHLVNQRAKDYEIWQQERISYGQGNTLSLLYAFWSYIGFKDAFTHLKSKIFLKSIPGLGVIRRGLPFGYICLFYTALEIYFYLNKSSHNSQVILGQVITGILMGLVLRRLKPMIK